MKTLINKLDIFIRAIALLLVLTVGVYFLFFGSKLALAANLKTSSTISESVMTVGDIFDGVPEDKATHILGPSPRPGEHITLNARTLTRVAIAMELPWRATSLQDQITITRSATIIDDRAIRDAVKNKLASAQGLDGKFRLKLYSGNPKMVIAPDMPDTVEVISTTYSVSNDFFEARIVAPSKDKIEAELVISGKVERLTDVPVLNKTMRNGETISAADIDWIELPEREVQHDILVNEKDIIGMTPQRMVLSNKLIREQEIQLPKIVKRGDNVTIVFQHGPLSLTAEGRALEDGAKDDLIRVVNTTSSRPIEAFVSGQGTVTVTQ